MSENKYTKSSPKVTLTNRAGVKSNKGTALNRIPRPKLLIGIVNYGEEDKVKHIINEVSLAFSFTFEGLGTARSHLLDYLGIGETEKSVMFLLIPETDEDVIIRALRAQLSLYLAGRGIAFTVPLAGISEIIANGLMGAATNKTIGEDKIMTQNNRKYNLIIAAVNANHVDEAMDVARDAGASGGTIIRARATDNVKAEQFAGISLMVEQELLLILAKRESSSAIMEALSENVGLKTPAGGVIFALPVDRTAGIAAEEQDDESEQKHE